MQESVLHRLNPNLISNIFEINLYHVTAACFRPYKLLFNLHGLVELILLPVARWIHLLPEFHSEMPYPHHIAAHDNLGDRIMPKIHELNSNLQQESTSQSSRCLEFVDSQVRQVLPYNVGFLLCHSSWLKIPIWCRPLSDLMYVLLRSKLTFSPKLPIPLC